MFYRLRGKDWMLLAALVALLYVWIMVDQIFLPLPWSRMVAFPLFELLLLQAYFNLVKPAKPFFLANTVAAVLIPLFIALSVILHVFVFKDGFQKKSAVLWLMTAAVIYLSAGVYVLSSGKKAKASR
jgi:hypothetical protein